MEEAQCHLSWYFMGLTMSSSGLRSTDDDTIKWRANAFFATTYYYNFKTPSNGALLLCTFCIVYYLTQTTHCHSLTPKTTEQKSN